MCASGQYLLTILIGWYTALSVASLEPFGPSSGSVSKPVKPPGFGVEGVDVGLPDTNSSKEFPFDLTDCDVDDCVICDQDDNTVCLMCSESATAKWRSADGSDCVSACDSSDVKIHTADRYFIVHIFSLFYDSFARTHLHKIIQLLLCVSCFSKIQGLLVYRLLQHQ